MVTKEFAEASAQINEIIQYMPKSKEEKVPYKLRDFFKKVAIQNDELKIDPYKPLNEQNLTNKTKDLIAILYRNYWCDEEKRKLLDKKLIQNDMQYEMKLEKKYDVDNIFNKRIKSTDIPREDVNNSLSIIKENFLKKLINKIRKFLK